MKTFLQHIKREAGRISKDSTLILTLLIAPIFYAFFYGSIYINKREKEVKIMIVDLDNSELSHTLSLMINESEMVEVIAVTKDNSNAIKSFKDHEIQGVLRIEREFEKNLIELKGTDITLTLNTSKFLPSNDLKEAISKITATMSAGVRLKVFNKLGNDMKSAKTKAQPILLEDHSIFITTTNYTDFLLPGLFLLILQQTFIIGLCESISRERELKTLKSWFSISQFSIWKSMFGKTYFYLILYAAYTIFFHVLNFDIFSIPNTGSAMDLFFLFSLFYISLVFLGTFLGSFFRKEIFALQFCAFTSYPVFLLAGYAWPIEALPEGLKMISFLLPTEHMLEAYIKIIYQGQTILDCIPEMINLTILIFFYASLAHFRIRYLAKKSVEIESIDNSKT